MMRNMPIPKRPDEAANCLAQMVSSSVPAGQIEKQVEIP